VGCLGIKHANKPQKSNPTIDTGTINDLISSTNELRREPKSKKQTPTSDKPADTAKMRWGPVQLKNAAPKRPTENEVPHQSTKSNIDHVTLPNQSDRGIPPKTTPQAITEKSTVVVANNTAPNIIVFFIVALL